jgi:hypothetical protein
MKKKIIGIVRVNFFGEKCKRVEEKTMKEGTLKGKKMWSKDEKINVTILASQSAIRVAILFIFVVFT